MSLWSRSRPRLSREQIAGILLATLSYVEQLEEQLDERVHCDLGAAYSETTITSVVSGHGLLVGTIHEDGDVVLELKPFEVVDLG